MNDFSKLMLSDEELQLANNREWILTKRIIIEKASALLGNLSADMRAVIENEKSWLPSPVVQSTPKIAKGENYMQLPYVLLDYPRCFDAENIFAMRTMFWWGNFFSITLHLSGSYKTMFQQRVIDMHGSFMQNLFICIHEDQWHHHFESDNYVSVQQLSGNEYREIILQKPFVKLAIKFPLHQWNDIRSILHESFREMIEMLKA